MTRPAALKKDPRIFMAWSGFFADPVMDGEAFRTLPGWRQREVTYRRECNARRHIPTRAEMVKFAEGEAGPARVEYSLPLNCSYESLVRSAPPAYPLDKVHGGVALGHLLTLLTPEALIAHCTAFGAGLKLRSDQPLHPLFAYAWTYAAYRKQMIPAMPLSALLNLEDAAYLGSFKNLRTPTNPHIETFLETVNRAIEPLINSLA